MGGRAGAWRSGGRARERMNGRAGKRALGRVDERSAGTFWYTISVFGSKFVIIHRADGLKWRGELKCFLIPEEFNSRQHQSLRVCKTL